MTTEGPINSGPFIAKARIEELEEENAELRAMLGLNLEIGRLNALGFTPQEARVVNLLATREMVNSEQVLFVCQPDNVDRRYEINRHYVPVIICHARRKLKALGCSVVTVRGYGWCLPPPDKERLRRALETPLRAAAE